MMKKNNTNSLLTVLISSIGRRSQLVSCFRRAFEQLGVHGRIIGVDSNPAYAPAAYLADDCIQVPPCTDPSFAGRVLSIAQQHSVSIVIPTIDTELPVYAASREQFRSRGIEVAVSGSGTIRIAADKAATNAWLNSHGISTVRQFNAQTVLSKIERWPLPVIVKPRCGSASIGVMKIASREMLKAALHSDVGLLVEEFAAGQEHTINIFVDVHHRAVCAVPHRRIETRGGEVSKGVTVKNAALIELGKRIGRSLPDAFGALNVQCFVDEAGTMRVTEINARFGGGFPLAHEAGAVFPLWLLQPLVGLDNPATFDCWTDGLTMLRYDSAAFLKGPCDRW
jgi:carbamoyl-phosphate synthase large subunit